MCSVNPGTSERYGEFPKFPKQSHAEEASIKEG